MPDHEPQPDRERGRDRERTDRLVEHLLSQDAELSEDNLGRRRMELEQALLKMEERARKVRRASLIGVGVTIACYLAILPIEFFRLTQIRGFAPFWVVVSNVSLVTTGVLLTLYWHKYRPAIDRQRSDLQLTMLADMQRQIAELRAGQGPK